MRGYPNSFTHDAPSTFVSKSLAQALFVDLFYCYHAVSVYPLLLNLGVYRKKTSGYHRAFDQKVRSSFVKAVCAPERLILRFRSAFVLTEFRFDVLRPGKGSISFRFVGVLRTVRELTRLESALEVQSVEVESPPLTSLISTLLNALKRKYSVICSLLSCPVKRDGLQPPCCTASFRNGRESRRHETHIKSPAAYFTAFSLFSFLS